MLQRKDRSVYSRNVTNMTVKVVTHQVHIVTTRFHLILDERPDALANWGRERWTSNSSAKIWVC